MITQTYSKPQAPFPHRSKVLIALYHDGWVASYAERTTDIVIVNFPFAGDSLEAQRLAEEYVTLTIPEAYRPLLVPGLIRATENHRLVLPSDIAATQRELETLASIRSMKSGEGDANVG